MSSPAAFVKSAAVTRGIGVPPMNGNDHGRDGHATCLGCLLFFLLASLACAADPDVRTGESAAAGARPLANLFQNSPSDDFRKAVAQLPELRVYEGLPDQKTEKSLYEKEKLRGDVTSFGEWNFYEKPLNLTESETASLRELFQPGNPFSPGGGGDACGKFHPDYALVWKSGEYVALIGLGCQEIHAIGPSMVIHRYIPPEIYAKFERILGKYTVNRPLPGP